MSILLQITEFTNPLYNSVINQAQILKLSILSTTSVPAIASTVTFLSGATSLSSLAKSFIPEGFALPNINFTSSLRDLTGIVDVTQATEAFNKIESQFGETLRGFGTSVSELREVADVAIAAGDNLDSVISTATGIGNLEVDEIGNTLLKSLGVSLPSFDPIEEFEALFNNNLSFASAQAELKNTLTSYYPSLEGLPKIDTGVFKVSSAAVTKKITQNFGGVSLTTNVCTPENAFEDGVRKTISEAGYSNRPIRTNETFTKFPITLKRNPTKIMHVIGKTSEAVISSDGSKISKFNLVPTGSKNEGDEYKTKLDYWKYNPNDDTLSIEQIYRKYESVEVIYKYNSNYDPTYAKPETAIP